MVLSHRHTLSMLFASVVKRWRRRRSPYLKWNLTIPHVLPVDLTQTSSSASLLACTFPPQLTIISIPQRIRFKICHSLFPLKIFLPCLCLVWHIFFFSLVCVFILPMPVHRLCPFTSNHSPNLCGFNASSICWASLCSSNSSIIQMRNK